MMWITRDKDGSLYVWSKKPKRYKRLGYWSIYGGSSGKTLGLEINSKQCPEITWETDPIQCSIYVQKNCKPL